MGRAGSGTGVQTFEIRDFDQWLRDIGIASNRLHATQKGFSNKAAETIVRWAKADAMAAGGVHAKSAKDIRTGGPGEVKYGGQPYNIGAEYGSYRYQQFDTWRGNGEDAGYFLWPAIRRFRDKEMTDLWQRQAWEAVRSVFVGSSTS